MAFLGKKMAIAVIGATGSGKSTFINLASGSNLPVCNSPRVCTTEPQSSTFSLDGRTVTLIDTPGFDESGPSVLDVLKSISEYFSRLYSQGFKFAGIAGDRMAGSTRHHFQTFCKFCGDTTLGDVVIVIDKYPEEVLDGESRQQGSDESFMRAVGKGARMLCHDGSQASAHAILCQLINRGSTMSRAKTETPHPPADPVCATTPADAVRELKNHVERPTKAFGKLHLGTNKATLAEDRGAKEVLQRGARNSLEKVERRRYDLERLVTDFAPRNSPLEDENQRQKNTFSVQGTEAELRTRLLGEERKARELAEAEQGRAEAQQAEERALLERGKAAKETLTVRVGQHYAKHLACFAVIFALVCVYRVVLHGTALRL